jgi:transposase
MCVIGIDISKKKFDICAIDNEKAVWHIFENTLSGFQKFQIWATRKSFDSPHFCMEATGCYSEALAEFLQKKSLQGERCKPFSSKALSRFKDD